MAHAIYKGFCLHQSSEKSSRYLKYSQTKDVKKFNEGRRKTEIRRKKERERERKIVRERETREGSERLGPSVRLLY